MVDAAEWNLEVERVLPQLKVTIRTDNKVHTRLSSCKRFYLCSSVSFQSKMMMVGLCEEDADELHTQFPIMLSVLQDWRIHVDQMHQHRDGIQSSLKEAKVRSLTCFYFLLGAQRYYLNRSDGAKSVHQTQTGFTT